MAPQAIGGQAGGRKGGKPSAAPARARSRAGARLMEGLVGLLAHWSYPIVAVSLAGLGWTMLDTVRRLERAMGKLDLVVTMMAIRAGVDPSGKSTSRPKEQADSGSTHQSGGASE